MVKLTIAAGLLVVSLIILCGLYLFLKGARNVQRALASTKWPHTAGVVVSSETTRSVNPATRSSRRSVTFSTRTVIRYQVDSREYTTDVLHFGQTLGSDDKSEAALQRIRFPAGKEVSVSYDPRAPSIGVLKPGLHPEAFWLPGASLALLIPAALCLLVGPGFVRDITDSDQTFQNSVNQAIEEARRGVAPDAAELPTPPAESGDRMMAAVAAVFGAVACGLGVLALTSGLARIWRGNASLSWPTTTGVVIDSPTRESADDTSDAAWYARFVYQYEVAGADHFNNVRRFAQVEGGGGSAEADRIAARYQKGATVKVSYFPTDPDLAVLEPGNPSAALWLPGIGVVLILFSAAIFIWVVPAIAR